MDLEKTYQEKFGKETGVRSLGWSNEHTQKIRFNYALKGRNTEGVITLLEGIQLGKAVIKVPIIHSLEFEEFLSLQKINYKKTNVLEEM